MKKNIKIIHSLPLCIGLVFLFNPNITVIDLLPDFIGYILICASLYRLCDLNEKLTEAYELFKKMAFIDAGKLLSVFWIFGMTVPSERNTSILLWTFVFSLFELIVLLPAYTKLFSGLTELGYRYPSDALFGMRKRVSRTDAIRNLTYVFVVFKAVLTVLPEFADLANYSYDETTTSVINIYRYIGIIRFLAIVPVVIIGIVWILAVIFYFRRICENSRLMTALASKYSADVLPKKGIFICRGYKTFVLIFTVAILLTVDIRLDSVNMLPDFLAAMLFIVAVTFLRKYCGKRITATAVLLTAFLTVSVVASIVEYRFFSMYYYEAIIKSDEARNAYVLMAVINGVNSLLGAGAFALICRLLSGVVDGHTGYVVGMEREGEREQRMINELHRELKKGLVLATIAFALYSVSDIFYDIYVPDFAYISLVNFAFAAFAVGALVKVLSSVRHAIETKYMLE